MEIRKDIEYFEGKYQASNHGRIKSLNRIINFGKRKGMMHGRILKHNIHRNGYCLVVVGKKKTVHRIIAETFIPNPNNLPQVNHIDGNKSNNNVNNLEWLTAKDNALHTYRILGHKKTSKKYKQCKFNINHLIYDIKNNIYDKILCDKYNISRATIYRIKKENNLIRINRNIPLNFNN